MNRREIRKVVLVAASPALAKPENRDLDWSFPSFGVRRIQASIASDPALADVELETWELPGIAAEELASRLLDARADLVGFSTYVWSFAGFLETARRLRRADPRISLIFGGPAAGPRMCALEPYADAHEVLDALVIGEGERTIREVLAAGFSDGDRLRAVAGLALPTSRGFEPTAPRPLDTRLDELASPSQLGLIPPGWVAYLETFRGCPMSCSFCEWGVMEAGAHFSAEYLERELSAIARARPVSIYQVDAALNLNKHAFRGLEAAARSTGALRDQTLITLLYPALLDEGHLRFLERVGSLFLTVGLQSFDEEVNTAVERRTRRDRFERVVADLDALPNLRGLAIELILGLPTDGPERFRASLERALAYGLGVRVYRCLVLPNGLMSRAPAAHQIRFDPASLALTSSIGWSREALAVEQQRLTELTSGLAGGYSGEYWWYFPPTRTRGARAVPSALLNAS